MASAASGILFEDVFVVNDIDVGGQVFHNVNRVVAKSETNQVDLIIDVQSELYRLKTKEKFTLALASTLDLTGRPDAKSWNPANEPSLLDKYDYGMHGKIFKCDPRPDSKVVIYISHGGMLMKITGDSGKLRELKQDERVYTLLRRVHTQ